MGRFIDPKGCVPSAHRPCVPERVGLTRPLVQLAKLQKIMVFQVPGFELAVPHLASGAHPLAPCCDVGLRVGWMADPLSAYRTARRSSIRHTFGNSDFRLTMAFSPKVLLEEDPPHCGNSAVAEARAPVSRLSITSAKYCHGHVGVSHVAGLDQSLGWTPGRCWVAKATPTTIWGKCCTS